MSTILPRRSLSLDFAKDGQASGDNYLDELSKLDPILTFSRASIATRFNASGVLETLAAGQPRFDYDPATLQPRGLLIEEARTNLFSRSEDLSHAAWPTVALITRTANAATSPAGTATATRLQGSAGTWYVFRSDALVSIGQSVTFSIWLKSNTGGAQVVRIYNANGGVSSDINLGTTWTRYSNTVVATGTTGSGGVVCGTPGAAADVLAWGAQLEVGAFATSYIPTTSAAVTRASDSCYTDQINPWYNGAGRTGTITVDFTLLDAAPSSTNYHIFSFDSNAGGLTRIMARVANGGSVLTGDFYNLGTFGGFFANFGTVAANNPYRIAVAYSPARTATTQNGANPAATTPTPPTFTGLRLNLFNDAGGQMSCGWLRRFSSLPYAVSDILLKSITT